MNILVLESSTTSAKAMLYDTARKAFTVSSQEYGESEGIGLLDAERVFAMTAALGRKLCESLPDPGTVSAVALVGTWHNIMLCDKDMKAQTPVYQWTYTGASELCKTLREDKEYTKNYHNKTGCMVNVTYAFFNLKLLQQKGYTLKDYLVCSQGTYNAYKLTGECVVTDVLVSGLGLLNTRKRDYDDDLMAELDITLDSLPSLVSYDYSCSLSLEGAAILGLKPGIPVIPPMPDGCMNQVGAGALVDGVMTFSMGTSGAIRLSTPGPVIPESPGTWCYLSPKAWLSGAATAGCCNCIDWLRNQFFGADIPYTQIERGASQENEPPVFLPFLYGERCPGWRDDRSGGFFDLKTFHTVYDMYRAVQEGVLFNLFHCYDILTQISGIPHTVKLSGGILNSPAWTQMCSDIFSLPMTLEDAGHASLMGGVVLAMEKLGLIGSLYEADIPSGRIVMPNPEKASMYRNRYLQYLYWYERSLLFESTYM